MPRWPVVVLLCALLGGPGLADAQDSQPRGDQEGSELELFELNEALKKETTVASTRALSVREAPGIVTVIGRDEIRASGARDLLDVLLLVPGFAPGVDVEGVVDVGLRGIWGHEGKILLLIDGMEMNDLLYSTNQLGLHYPVNLISSLEIIRGPGSVRYGGYAELAVINVKTLSASELQGGDVNIRLGKAQHGEGTRTVSAAGGATTERFGGASFSAAAYLGAGMRSDADYVDPSGAHASLLDRSALSPAFIDVGASWRNLHLRYLHDGYSMSELDSYGEALQQPVQLSFVGDYFDASYALQLGEHLTVTPRLSWKRQAPWNESDQSAPEFWLKIAQRSQAGVVAAWDALEALTLTAGAEAYVDRAWLDSTDIVGSQTQYDGHNDVHYTNVAALAEAQWRSWVGNLIGGLRYEHHSRFGSSLVPRLALTKAFDQLHFKLLASRAFRAPGIENINAGQAVTPEYTTDLEAEVGYAFSNGLFVSANAFETRISDPIVYSYDPVADAEYYKNFSATGARGFEAELQYRQKRGWASLSYSFASSAPNEVDVYRVAGEPSRVLGVPAHKVTLRGSVRVWRELSLEPSGYLLGDRWAMVGDGAGGTTLQKLDARLVLNLFASWKNIGGSNFDARAGVSNLFDQHVEYVQPYDGGHPPLPGPGREYVVELEARFP